MKRRCEPCKANRKTKDNKTTAVCDLCLTPTCANHYIRVCERCYLHKFKDPDTLNETDDDDDDDGDACNASQSTSNGRPAKRARESIINL